MTDIKLSRKDEEDLLAFLEKYAQNISKKHINEIEIKLEKKLTVLRHNKKLPSFVKVMISQIKDLNKLFVSASTSSDDHKRVIAALHYFVWAEDRIPDYIPVVGYLDDAFIIATVYNEVKREIKCVKKQR